MYLPDNKSIIWNMQNEQLAENQLNVYFMNLLNRYQDIYKWIADYEIYYKEWLNNDENTIFELNHTLLQSILQTTQQVNKELPENQHLYYWFDIDRAVNENFEWKHCPITNEPLINLGADYFYTNRFVSPKVDLVFPAKE